MIAPDSTDDASPAAAHPAALAMERKLSEQKWPPPPPTSPGADSPDTDSARSTPEAGAEATGAIPKSRSIGRLDALRSSLREVGKGGSFKLGRKKQGEPGAKEEKKKSKKSKKKEAAASLSLPEASARAATLETPGAGAGAASPKLSVSTESLPTKAPKVSKATSLVRKLSIGRYRGGKNRESTSAKSTMSPTTTSPELSPAASRTDVSEDEAPSVASSTSSGRHGPEGDDGALLGETPSTLTVVTVAAAAAASSPPSPAQPPPPAATLGQSRLIASGANKGLADQSRGLSASPLPRPHQSSAPRRDRDPALETVPEAQSHEEALAAPQPRARSPPATPAFQSAAASLDEAAEREDGAAAASSRAAAAAFMPQRPGAASASAPTDTKSQILSITTPALKKQQAFEEIRAAAVAAAAAAPPPAKPSTVSAPVAPPPDEPEDEQFGDLDDLDDVEELAAPERYTMSAPPPSAATVMAEARARLSQSLSGNGEGATLPVNEKREHLYKILVIGELGTGKTSIIKRYVHQFFSQHYRATIGVDFALKVLNWDANTVIRLQLWDIAGQERFGNMTRVYYKEAVGAFIVFDVTRAATFDAVIKWKQDLDAKVQLADGSPIPCVLLANKCDQQKEGIVNNAAKMDEYCKERGFSAWFETSAKENINIEDAARCLVTKILQNDKLIHNENGKDNDKFALDGKAQKDEKSGKSCAC